MSIGDAVIREAAWLTAVDSLPSLLKTDGGPFEIVQPYWPRTIQARKTGLYLLRSTIGETRFANQRKLDQYQYRAKLWWPVGATASSTGIAEAEQTALDLAVDDVLARIRGVTFDHTHGGRFLSVAESPNGGRIDVRYADPEQTLASTPACLRAEITYAADDRDFTG